ncbi:MAG: sensor histidine kinase [Planctomycetes bacterium]|nr:sensor histidine kinase [Planctomycetota bacterium]
MPPLCRLEAGAPRGQGILLLVSLLFLSHLSAAEPLTTAGAVRELLPSQAAEKIPVTLTGVVTYYRSDKLPDFILQDLTGGVHVRQPKDGWQHVEPGDEVEIEGVTDAAVYAPRVDAKAVRKLGRADIPLAIPVSAEELAAGYHEGWLVEVNAVVRAAFIDVTIDPPRLVLRLGTPAGAVDAMITRYGTNDAARYLDAAIRLRGVSLRQANRRNEPYRWMVFVHTVDDIVVTRPPPSDPFAVPLTPIESLLAGGPQQSRHRMRVRGVVTYNDGMLVIQQGAAGISVFPVVRAEAKPGDEVEVVAFARIGMYNPVLEQALVHVVGHVGEPTPEEPPLAKLKPREVAERDWRLITVTGIAGPPTKRDEEAGFTLRTDTHQIPVRLPPGVEAPAVGAQVRVTGVCDLMPGRDVLLLSTTPTTFALLMRSGNDLTLLNPPPWWTRERLLALLVSVVVALLLALVWVVELRRRVVFRSRQLAEEIHKRREAQVAFDATATERKRLAGELHDSLEQGLTGVALQLDAATMGLPQAPAPLTMARTLLTHCRAEVRRAVWDLNADEREERDLPARLRAVAEQAVLGHEARVVVEVQGTAVPASGLIAHHCSRIVQEAVHNALRHGKARSITITVAFTVERLDLTIADDGAGFDPGAAAGPDAGHFGVQGMRERARKISGELAIVSNLGAGTRITVQVPRTGAAAT